MEARSPRPQLATSGTFLSIPSAYSAANPGVRNAIKLEVRPIYSASSTTEVETVFFPDRILVDLGAITAESIDIDAIEVDCDLVKNAIGADPGAVKRIIGGLQSGTLEGIRDAEAAAADIGLTEEAAVAKGGGLLFLAVVVVAAVGLSGCVKRGDQMKPGNQPTTPGHGTGGGAPGDAGPGDAGGQN